MTKKILSDKKRQRLRDALHEWNNKIETEEADYLIDKYYPRMHGRSISLQLGYLRLYAKKEILEGGNDAKV